MLVVDANILVEAADRRSRFGDVCRSLLRENHLLTVPSLAFGEAGHLVRRRLGPDAEVALAQATAEGEFHVAGPDEADMHRIAELTKKYADLPLGVTDASIIAMAERVETLRIATLDRRDFTVVRNRDGDAFELLP